MDLTGPSVQQLLWVQAACWGLPRASRLRACLRVSRDESVALRKLRLPDQDLGTFNWVGGQMRRTGAGQADGVALLQRARFLEVCCAPRDVHVDKVAVWHADRLPRLEPAAPQHGALLADGDR